MHLVSHLSADVHMLNLFASTDPTGRLISLPNYFGILYTQVRPINESQVGKADLE